MGKMMMEVGDWLGHGGTVRGGARTVQVRGDLGKNAAVVIRKRQWVNWGMGEAEEKGSDIKFGTQIAKVPVVSVLKYCFGIHEALGHKIE